MWVAQRGCEVQMATQGKGALRPIPVPVLEACVRAALNFNPDADRLVPLARQSAEVRVQLIEYAVHGRQERGHVDRLGQIVRGACCDGL